MAEDALNPCAGSLLADHPVFFVQWRRRRMAWYCRRRCDRRCPLDLNGILLAYNLTIEPLERYVSILDTQFNTLQLTKLEAEVRGSNDKLHLVQDL